MSDKRDDHRKSGDHHGSSKEHPEVSGEEKRNSRADPETLNQLERSCRDGDVEGVRRLIEGGISTEARNINGWTSLMLACQNGHESMARLLIDKGANIETTNNYGWNPLMLACQNGHESVARLLIEKGAKTIYLNQNQVDRLFAWACKWGKGLIARDLVPRVSDINAKDINGSTPLMIACENGSKLFAKLLIENGANIIDLNQNQVDRLFVWSCKWGKESIARDLIPRVSNINAKDINGSTPLMIACENGHKSVVQTLINKGALINTKDINGSTPLMIACEKDHESVVRFLIEKEFTIRTRDNNKKIDGQTLERLSFSELKRMILGESLTSSLFLFLSFLNSLLSRVD